MPRFLLNCIDWNNNNKEAKVGFSAKSLTFTWMSSFSRTSGYCSLSCTFDVIQNVFSRLCYNSLVYFASSLLKTWFWKIRVPLLADFCQRRHYEVYPPWYVFNRLGSGTQSEKWHFILLISIMLTLTGEFDNIIIFDNWHCILCWISRLWWSFWTEANDLTLSVRSFSTKLCFSPPPL